VRDPEHPAGDTIWKKKKDQTEHDPPPIDTLKIELGGGTSQHCYVCTFERRISNCRVIGNDTWCDVKWHLIDCEYVGRGACSQYAYAPGMPPGLQPQPRPPPTGEGVVTVLACGGAPAPATTLPRRRPDPVADPRTRQRG